MTARVKSILLLLATLLIGMVLGALVNARLAEQRLERIAFLRSQRGFIQAMERAIAPHDEAQREAVRAILDEAALRMATQLQQNGRAMQAILDSTKTELQTVLDADQLQRLERLEERLERRRPRGPGPRERRAPRRRPPPP